ncbi:MAG: hypothetical protein WAZ77_14250 [Candidatus Nitrosopolaris sp.]
MYPARPLRKTLQILLTGPPGQAKTLFSKCIIQGFGKNKEFFTVGGNASKSGMIEVLFDMRPTYLLVDEIERGIVRNGASGVWNKFDTILGPN